MLVDTGFNNPADSYELKGALNVPILQFTVYNLPGGSDNVNLNSIRITAGGTANDVAAITAAKLVLDANENGLYDVGESVLTGAYSFGTDNGIATLFLTTPRTILIGEYETYLVVCDISNSVTSGETISLTIAGNGDINCTEEFSGNPAVGTGAPVMGNVKTVREVTATNTAGPAPLKVNLNCKFGAGGSVMLYQWDFDYDGISLNPDYFSMLSGNCYYTYTQPGNYTARVRIIRSDGNILERDIAINATLPSDPPVINTIYTTPALPSGPAPLTVTFRAATKTTSGRITVYSWDFDGNGSIDFASTVTDTVTYAYTRSGLYPSTLFVEDSNGLGAEYSVWVTVQSSVSTAPTANITAPASGASVMVGDTLLFSGSGTAGSGGVVARYEWDFDGDNEIDIATTAATDVSCAYLASGSYTAKLRVTEEPSLLSAEKTITLTVSAPTTTNIAIIQPGVQEPGKQGLRRKVNGVVTIQAATIPALVNPTQGNSVDLRYRLVDASLPDSAIPTAPAPWDGSWQTVALAQSSLPLSSISYAGFTTTIDTSFLLPNNWYEIIGVTNYNETDMLYDAWNTDSPDKRVFIYVDPITPDVQGDITQSTYKVSTRGISTLNIRIPYQGVSADGDLIITSLTATDFADLGGAVGGLTISLTNSALLTKPAEVIIPYSDSNNDGVVDGANIPETTLVLYREDAVSGWIPVAGQKLITDSNVLIGVTAGVGRFRIAGIPPPMDMVIDGSSGLGSSGSFRCFIATAAFGTPLAEEVKTLRRFRDKYLIKHLIGQRFVESYYRISPPLAKIVAQDERLKAMARIWLKQVVDLINIELCH
ncbi:MAG: PKD domain-containing protein [Planctomycetes bacterium]|nr:PKD domain-containing protein [Planctomycetota bacterium]